VAASITGVNVFGLVVDLESVGFDDGAKMGRFTQQFHAGQL